MNYAIILAGGKGTRFGNKEIPKQFIELTSVPVSWFTPCVQLRKILILTRSA